MLTPNFTGLLEALRKAEDALAEYEYTKSTGARTRARVYLTTALNIAETALGGQRCEGPECGKPVEYSGIGRPARYCGKRCRDRAAYARKRQRVQREG